MSTGQRSGAVHIYRMRLVYGINERPDGPRPETDPPRPAPVQTSRRVCYGREPDKNQALRQIRQSLSTLHSQVGRNRESVSGALHPLNSVDEKDFP